jgi:hypothetical protein
MPQAGIFGALRGTQATNVVGTTRFAHAATELDQFVVAGLVMSCSTMKTTTTKKKENNKKKENISNEKVVVLLPVLLIPCPKNNSKIATQTGLTFYIHKGNMGSFSVPLEKQDSYFKTRKQVSRQLLRKFVAQLSCQGLPSITT